tara:strand:- start:7689 stop:7937 length:249 start_codon:yes stop_codon:yes gene_type:complete
MGDKINKYNDMKDKDYLTFYVGDGGDRESASVYYARVVSAPSKRLAIKKFITDWEKLSDTDTISESTYRNFDAEPIEEMRLQ